MSPVTHFLAGWVLADGWSNFRRRGPLSRPEKATIALAGVAPDIDGLGAIPELLTRHSSHPLLWFSQYHHALHTLAVAILVAAVAWAVSARSNSAFGPDLRGRAMRSHPAVTTTLAFLSFHLHLFCDLIGARGPDRDQWPIPYLKPFSNSMQLAWHGQWALNGWQNFVITGLLLAATFWMAWRFGSSPVELLSQRWNRELAQALRRRFGATATDITSGAGQTG